VGIIRFIKEVGVYWRMRKKASTRRPPLQPLQPLANGQVWRTGEMILQVTLVGKMLVHYKLGKPNATRVPSSIDNIKTIEKYLKAKKAVLV
jgi:hypothetical protein